jgi:ribonucleoside-diphosphate reductase alpha chain
MMAAAQPFISGAISKTINLPNSATVDDIKSAYRLSWELGLKANALYRDGCKLSQPLSTKVESADGGRAVEDLAAGKSEAAAASGSPAANPATERVAPAALEAEEGAVRTVEKIVEKIVERPHRRRLPDTRQSITHKFNVAGHEGYVTVGLYEDGTPGELFITMAKEGSTIGGLMDSLGTAISVALQYGVPIESLVGKFTHQRFEPAGMTHNPDIPFAKSLVDYIFRWLGMQFIPGYRAANAPQRPGSGKPAIPATPAEAAAKSNGTNGSYGAGAAGNGESSNGIGHRGDAAGGGLVRPGATNPGKPAGQPPSAGGGGLRAELTWATSEYHLAAQGFAAVDALAKAMTQMQADAPACDVCGTITVRNGTCYKCLNCGNSMGCS